MRKLFIHTPVFRFLSPIFSGIIAYLLILLVNNNIGQLQEQFLGQELYVCIGLSFITHEFSRFLLWLFKKLPNALNSLVLLTVKIICAVLLSGFLIGALITAYYLYQSGYYPLMEELKVFVGIYCFIPLGYILIDMSHEYLFKVNSQKLENELLIKENIEEDFKQFKREINPNLLFESFESLLILIKNDKDKSDEFIDHLASIYRYILSRKDKQLIDFWEEISIANELVKLFSYLPFRSIRIKNNCEDSFMVVPGTLLFVVEQIIRTIIIAVDETLDINFNETTTSLEIAYLKNDKLINSFNVNKLREVVDTYQIYNTQHIEIVEEEQSRKIIIPKLKIIA